MTFARAVMPSSTRPAVITSATPRRMNLLGCALVAIESMLTVEAKVADQGHYATRPRCPEQPPLVIGADECDPPVERHRCRADKGAEHRADPDRSGDRPERDHG